MKYYARTCARKETGSPAERATSWQELRRHLVHVSWLARKAARTVAPEDEGFALSAQWAGLLHDLGKYQHSFQQRLIDASQGRSARRVAHSVYGAASVGDAKAYDVLMAVLGHHAGLSSLSEVPSKVGQSEQNLALKLRTVQTADFAAAARLLDGAPPAHRASKKDAIELDLRIRMLLSCLVDADRLDAYRHDTGSLPSSPPLEPSEQLRRLLAHVAAKAASAQVEEVRKARRKVLEACLAAASWPERLLSLNVPTGGGKTLSSMAFALRRAIERPDEVRRIIVVIPFLSIIEQNAGVFREAMGPDAILEHHSGDFSNLRIRRPKANSRNRCEYFVPASEGEDDRLLSAAAGSTALDNWDWPIVVTTSVRFFESLFSNHPSDLRRLHNIARSVVILDEVQTLPVGFLAPILSMMEALARDWCTTFVCCTATQPAFEKSPHTCEHDPRWEPGTIREIVPDAASLFQVLKRTEVDMLEDGEEIEWHELALRMVGERRALCIVNVRKDARCLYSAVKAAARDVGICHERIFHLSTDMCARHRLDRLRAIRSALKQQGKPCLVIATQLVEAGVDLDFPVVFRAMGPFDSIAQAAGRCDREGKLTAAASKPAGRVYVFEAPGQSSPPGIYRMATQKTRRRFKPGVASIHDPVHIRNYFEDVYGDTDADVKNIQALRRRLAFRDVAEEFHMIDDRTQAVLVPYRRMGRYLIDRLVRGDSLDADMWRKAQQYQVGLYPHAFDEAQQMRTIIPVTKALDLWVCAPECYSPEVGLEIKLATEANIV